MNKTDTVIRYLRSRIASGAFPGGKLPREVDLSTALQVGRVTVRAALEVLEQEGAIVRKRHTGTFVKPDLPKAPIGVISRTRGHLYAELYDFLLHAAMMHNVSLQVVSTSSVLLEEPTVGRKSLLYKSVERLLHCRCSGWIVDGNCHPNVPLIGEVALRNPVFFDYFDAGELEMPEYGVWIDYERAGYLGAQYLLQQGCRHPLLVCHYLPYHVRFHPNGYQRHRDMQIQRGFRKLLAEHDMDRECFILGNNYSSVQEREDILRELIRNPKLRPDGILFAADTMALKPLKWLHAAGLAAGRDIHLVGIGNTPWSGEESFHPFSSIDLQLEYMADELIRMAIQTPEQRVQRFVEPVLVER